MSSATCGHTFCGGCISEALSHTPQCPVDRSSLRAVDLKPAHAIIRNLVDELLVECSNKEKGCAETPQRHLAAVHERDLCGFTAVPCPSSACQSKPLRKDLATHQKKCDRRLIECPACKRSIPFADAEMHANECPRGFIACLDCGIEVPREELSSHGDTCPLATVSCPHATVGCPWVGIRHDLQMLDSDASHEKIASNDHYHLASCPYEALRGFFELQATQNASLRAENTALREEICSLRSGMRELVDEMGKARAALGPWLSSEGRPHYGAEQRANSYSSQAPTQISGLSPHSQTPDRIPGRRRLSSPFTNGMLGFPDPARQTDSSQTSGTSTAGTSSVSPPSSPPPPDHLIVGLNGPTGSFGLPVPTLLIQDYQRLPIAPVEVNGSLVGSLEGLRVSIVRVAGEVEGVGRRLDMQFTTEMLRMHEEVAGLRATVHGLRMQVHSFMTSNAFNGSGGIGYTQYGAGDSATVQYVNQSPPPSTVISIANTVTHRRVAENKL